MAKTIPVSFKENTKDIELYKFLDALDDSKSGYIKRAIRFYRDYELQLKQISFKENSKMCNEDEDISDILGI